MRFPRSLTATFLLLLLGTFLVAGGAFTAVVVRHAADSRRLEEISDRLRRTAELNQRLRSQIDAQTSLVHEFLIGADAELLRRYESLHFEISRAQVDYLRLPIDDAERIQVARIREMQERLAGHGAVAMESVRSGDSDDGMRKILAMERAQAELNAAFEELSRLQLEQLGDTLAQAENSLGRTYLVLSGIAVLLGGLVVAVGHLLRSRVWRPLMELLNAARRIREGDLEARAPSARDDEVGRVAREFNYMARSLEESYADLERKVDERTRELRELQAQLVQSERMSAVGQLVGGVAHELNNPLTAIIGLAALEMEEVDAHRNGGGVVAPDGSGSGRRLGDGGDGSDRTGVEALSPRTTLEQILHQAERCRRIVQDLLQFARRRESRREPVSLNEVVERTLRLRDHDAETRSVRLERRYDRPGPLVMADSYKLEQVVIVLVNNALDAVRDAGGPGVVEVSTRCEGGRAVLEVRDDGTGIEDPSRVFEPFYTTKEVGEGTGLGLSVAYGIVQEHGGELHAENRPDGALFAMELPLAEPPTAGGSPDVSTAAAEASGDGGTAAGDEAPGAGRRVLEDLGEAADGSTLPGRILVIDDEEAVLGFQARLVEESGAAVETAASGDTALTLLEEKRFDAVICDLRMPGMDGRAVYEWVREHRPRLADRFVFATGDVIRLDEALGGLDVRHIEKPFRVDEYRVLIRELLEEES